MTAKLILPKTLCDVDQTYGPVFFLAGPIKGGGDWQAECYAEIARQCEKCYVVSPRRYSEEHPLFRFRQTGIENSFERQTLWERCYLDIASTAGCIIFWLPAESTVNPRTDGQPYARDTYGELGEWRGRLMADRNLRLVIGAESEFSGLDVIRRNYQAAIGQTFPIYSTLAETVRAAIKKTQD